MNPASHPPTTRPGSEFFSHPATPNQRRYEALRAYFLEGASLQEVAERFGYALNSVSSLVRDFRAGQHEFFLRPKSGPKVAKAKEAARPQVVKLRRQGLSAYEIADALKDSPTPLNRTGVAEILREEGFARFQPRPHALRGGPSRAPLVRAERIDVADLPVQFHTPVAGIFLVIPELLQLELPQLVSNAGYPSSPDIPALSYILSLLALKLIAVRRISHVTDAAHDPALGLFTGLSAIPKITALSTYSHRCEHDQQRHFLAQLAGAMRRTELCLGTDFDLDFHAIMHYGSDPVLEAHYVPRRSQRTTSVLTFFAQDHQTRNVIYANADLLKKDQGQEVLRFCEHWRATTGGYPETLVLDSKVTTYAVLSQLNQLGIRFITLRPRRPGLLERLHQLPANAWRSVQLQRAAAYRRVQVFEEQVQIRDYEGQLRQLAIRGLGHEEPTILLSNDFERSPKLLTERYSGRMDIENRLSQWIRAFHIDALSSTVPLNVDHDIVISVLAGAVCDSFRQRLRGYATATPDTLQYRFFDTGGDITISRREVVVSLQRRAYSPVLRQARIPSVQVPWWGDRRLRFEHP